MRGKIAVLGLLALAVFSGCAVAQETIDNKEASDVLQIAVTTAVAYGVTHNGSYSGMDASGLTTIDRTLQWTDAEPGPGQVQVVSADGDNYTIVYKNLRGAVFTATRQNGELTFTNSTGDKL